MTACVRQINAARDTIYQVVTVAIHSNPVTDIPLEPTPTAAVNNHTSITLRWVIRSRAGHAYATRHVIRYLQSRALTAQSLAHRLP